MTEHIRAEMKLREYIRDHVSNSAVRDELYDRLRLLITTRDEACDALATKVQEQALALKVQEQALALKVACDFLDAMPMPYRASADPKTALKVWKDRIKALREGRLL